jgi:hypothetical protein
MTEKAAAAAAYVVVENAVFKSAAAEVEAIAAVATLNFNVFHALVTFVFKKIYNFFPRLSH